MHSLKEKLILIAAVALYCASQALFLAAHKEHIKHCPRHKKTESDDSVHSVN